MNRKFMCLLIAVSVNAVNAQYAAPMNFPEMQPSPWSKTNYDELDTYPSELGGFETADFSTKFPLNEDMSRSFFSSRVSPTTRYSYRTSPMTRFSTKFPSYFQSALQNQLTPNTFQFPTNFGNNGFNAPGGFPGFNSMFRRFLTPVDMTRMFRNQMKPFAIKQAKMRMQSGLGGVTLVISPDKTLIKRDDTVFECLGTILNQEPFCDGPLKRFQIQSRHDYCYSERYSKLGDMICIGHSDQRGLSFTSNNGQNSCVGSDERPTLLISTLEYQQMCGKLPWDTTYQYIPNPASAFHVNLPNYDVGCTHPDYCIFKPDNKSPISF